MIRKEIIKQIGNFGPSYNDKTGDFSHSSQFLIPISHNFYDTDKIVSNDIKIIRKMLFKLKQSLRNKH